MIKLYPGVVSASSLPAWVRHILVPVTRIELRRNKGEYRVKKIVLQQNTDEVMESEDGSVEFETPTDDEEIMIPSQDKYRKVPDIPDSDIRDEQTLSNTQREDWLLSTEPMHGTRPRQTGRERPPVIDNPALRDVAGNTAVRNPSRTFLLSPGRRISREEEVFTAPGGGGGLYVRYEPYPNLFRMVFRRTVYEMEVSVRRTLGLR